MNASPIIPLEAYQLVQSLNETDGWKALNRFERECAERPQIVCPLRHIFTPVPGYPELFLYTRQIVMPKGAIISSRIHLYEHPFIISAGVLSIWGVENGWQMFKAPYTGITKAGTRRVLYIHEETTFSTFHVTRHTDPDKVVEEVTYDHLKLGHMDGIAPEKLAAVLANVKGISQ